VVLKGTSGLPGRLSLKKIEGEKNEKEQQDARPAKALGERRHERLSQNLPGRKTTKMTGVKSYTTPTVKQVPRRSPSP